jgi:hypothetical protein
MVCLSVPLQVDPGADYIRNLNEKRIGMAVHGPDGKAIDWELAWRINRSDNKIELQVVADRPGTDWSELANEVKEALRDVFEDPELKRGTDIITANTTKMALVFVVTVGSPGVSSVLLDWLNEHCNTLVSPRSGLTFEVSWDVKGGTFRDVLAFVRRAPHLDLD